MQINITTYEAQNFTCPNCSWEGKGYELDIENFSEDHFIIDFECPECYQHIGSGQAPLRNENDCSQEDYSKDSTDGSIS